MKDKFLFALITGILLMTLIGLSFVTIRYFTYDNLFGEDCQDYSAKTCPEYCVVLEVKGEMLCHARE